VAPLLLQRGRQNLQAKEMVAVVQVILPSVQALELLVPTLASLLDPQLLLLTLEQQRRKLSQVAMF